MSYIEAEFKEKGYRRKDGKALNKKQLYFMLHNIRYTGRVEHNGVIYENIFPRIIDDIAWEAVMNIYNGNKFVPSPKKEKYDYILTGKLICGDCKTYMRGECGTSRTGEVHYYYICSSKRRKKVDCHSKPVKKIEFEDIIINHTCELFGDKENLHKMAENIHRVHIEQTKNNVNLKSLEKKRAEVKKACDNMVKAIEMGVITEMTASRLKELETQLLAYDFDIEKERQKTYAYLSLEDIEAYLQSEIFNNKDDMKTRRLIVNTFIREIVLFEDKIIITYNFKKNSDTGRHTPETVDKMLKDIDSAFKSEIGSAISLFSEP